MTRNRMSALVLMVEGALFLVPGLAPGQAVPPGTTEYLAAVDAQRRHNVRLLRQSLAEFERNPGYSSGNWPKIKACKARIRVLEAGKGHPTPTMDPFRLRVGQVGVLGKTSGSVTREMAKQLGEMKLVTYGSADYKIIQVLKDAVLLRVIAADRDFLLIYLEGISTKGLVTDRMLRMRGKLFHVAGTKTYETVAGGTNTVFVLRMLDEDKITDYLEKNKPAVITLKPSPKPSTKPKGQPKKEFVVRTWTDTNTKQAFEAEFLGVAFGKVKLRKKDGTELQIPVEQLSLQDQAWIRSRRRGSR